MNFSTDASVTDRLSAIYATEWSSETSQLLFAPLNHGTVLTLEDGFEMLDRAFEDIDGLIPLAVVDDRSVACVALEDGVFGQAAGAVVRVHLDEVSPRMQLMLLDVDPVLYVQSLQEELASRDEGLTRMLEQIGPAYELQYLVAEKRPRDFVIRPVRLACQNVIVGLAAFAHDSSFDGMSVVAWQTCEVPHVATHEGNRALAALTLCDAFQSGGTMEVRFDRPAGLRAEGTTPKSGERVDVHAAYTGHPEGRVPASLRRYGRTVGVLLGNDAPGTEDPGGISPAQARELFVAVTPMPEDLSLRVYQAWQSGVATPERLCFTLLSQVWREIELDFMLACSARAGSIISGGADWHRRTERQAESELARAALMIGMLYRRLDATDTAGAESEARVVEDNRVGVSWEVLPEFGGVRFSNLLSERLPWQVLSPDGTPHVGHEAGQLTVLPRGMLDAEVIATARSLDEVGAIAVTIPNDADGTPEIAAREGLLLMRCPDRLGELDQVIERKLLTARISRA